MVIQYNRIVRKLVVAFGDLFNNITMVRYTPNETEQERFLVPISYATKERYVLRLEDDPNLDKKVKITLPRFSYELTGFNYDTSRKLNTNVKNFHQGASGISSQFNPVPYNFDFNLYLYTRNIEDATQILEHIIPYFTPDYTIKVNMIPEIGMVKEVPVVLNSANHEIIYEGPREQDVRTVIWTLNFTMKGYIFGRVSSGNVITQSITNTYDTVTENKYSQIVTIPDPTSANAASIWTPNTTISLYP